MEEFNFWLFIAAVAVFVYAMSLIEHSVKNLAGRSFKKFLQKQSKDRIKMIAASTVVTAFLQSSSVVLLMVLSFVGGGLMNLRGALAATLGCNLGTTLDSWVIALIGFKINFNTISYSLLGIALFGLLLFRSKTRIAYITTFLIGFAFIFISLEWFKSCVDKSLESYLGNFKELHYLLFIAVGLFITAIIQSSSVTIAITLSALHNQLIPFESAAAVVIGSELGTTLKFLIGSVNGSADKKRVAWGNSFMNLATMMVAALMLQPLLYFIRETIGIKDALTGLVVFQTGINLAAVLVFYPTLGMLARFLENIFREDADDEFTKYIGKSAVALPGDALEISEKEIAHLMYETIEFNKWALSITKKETMSWVSTIIKLTSDSSFSESYEKLKLLQGEILEYIAEIPKEGMTEAEVEQTGRMINIIRHVLRSSKNLKDIRHNLDEFESSANDELFDLYEQMRVLARDFYEEFRNLLNDTGRTTQEKIAELVAKNRKEYDASISVMLSALKNNSISELDSSNLLNVYREIYSSNKALIRALADLRGLETED
jgi:phosphate:Na+ symporter